VSRCELIVVAVVVVLSLGSVLVFQPGNWQSALIGGATALVLCLFGFVLDRKRGVR